MTSMREAQLWLRVNTQRTANSASSQGFWWHSQRGTQKIQPPGCDGTHHNTPENFLSQSQDDWKATKVVNKPAALSPSNTTEKYPATSRGIWELQFLKKKREKKKYVLFSFLTTQRWYTGVLTLHNLWWVTIPLENWELSPNYQVENMIQYRVYEPKFLPWGVAMTTRAMPVVCVVGGEGGLRWRCLGK